MSHLWIGVGKVSLHFRHARSLKDKRNWLKSIEQKLRNAGFSVTECGFQDNEKRGIVGFSYASDEAPNVDQAMDKAIRFFEGDFEIIQADRDVFDYSEMKDEEEFQPRYPLDEMD